MSKYQEPVRDIVVVRCSSCGKKEFIEISDRQYLEDVLRELGWEYKICPKCQEKK